MNLKFKTLFVWLFQEWNATRPPVLRGLVAIWLDVAEFMKQNSVSKIQTWQGCNFQLYHFEPEDLHFKRGKGVSPAVSGGGMAPPQEQIFLAKEHTFGVY